MYRLAYGRNSNDYVNNKVYTTKEKALQGLQEKYDEVCKRNERNKELGYVRITPIDNNSFEISDYLGTTEYCIVEWEQEQLEFI